MITCGRHCHSILHWLSLIILISVENWLHSFHDKKTVRPCNSWNSKQKMVLTKESFDSNSKKVFIKFELVATKRQEKNFRQRNGKRKCWKIIEKLTDTGRNRPRTLLNDEKLTPKIVNKHFPHKKMSPQCRHTTKQVAWDTEIHHSTAAAGTPLHGKHYERGCYGVCCSVAMECEQLVLNRYQTYQRQTLHHGMECDR